MKNNNIPNTTRDVAALGSAFIALIAIPIIGTIIRYRGNVPSNFYEFPPLSVDSDPKAPFNVYIFSIIAVACIYFTLLYIFPQWFGFKKVTTIKNTHTSKGQIPLWFWFGSFIFGVSLIFLWGIFSEPKWIVNWLLIPLFWGIIFIVDGIVYYRTRGESLVGSKPQTLIAIAICSVGGWLFFEFLNFFVHKNWYYPFGNLISAEQFLLYSSIGSSALLTIVFEWYMLLKTFPKIANKYSQGPRIQISRKIWYYVLFISLALLFLIPFLPNQLFFVIWLVPMTSLLSVLHIRNMWSPFTPIINKGNWGPLALICLSYLIQGFLYEFWNYFGAHHNADGTIVSYNPGYWVYSIPYVQKFHIFEMPLLGLFGYLPFGLYCWTAWLVFAQLIGVNPRFDDSMDE